MAIFGTTLLLSNHMTRRRPYTQIGVQRLPCSRCGCPAKHQWRMCADGCYRPVCAECDIRLNRLVLAFLRVPDRAKTIANYQKRLVKTNP